MATRILPQSKAARPSATPLARRRRRYLAQPQTERAARAALWGHLGLRLAGDERTRWYPISDDQADALTAQLRSGAAWITTATLNNRALLMQAAALQRLVLLDDDADEPDGDGAVQWDNAVGYTQDVYEALDACYLSGSRADRSPAMDVARSIIDGQRLGECDLHGLLRLTRLTYRDGSVTALPMDARASWATFHAASEGEVLPFIDLACLGHGYECFAPREQVALLDMPLHRLLEAAADMLGELQAESARREQRRGAMLLEAA